jgi:hypothetical protein
MATNIKIEKCEPSIRHEKKEVAMMKDWEKEEAKVNRLERELKAHENMPMSKAHKNK